MTTPSAASADVTPLLPVLDLDVEVSGLSARLGLSQGLDHHPALLDLLAAGSASPKEVRPSAAPK